MKSPEINTYLIFQKGFTWHTKGACNVKGYLFTPDGNFLFGEELAAYFSGIHDIEKIKSAIRTSNGCFSLIVMHHDVCLLAVDPVRTFPLLYSFNKNTLFISDSFDTLLDKVNNVALNMEAAAEFMATGYVTGKETLCKGIKQVQAGEMIIFKTGGEELAEEFYHTYQTDTVYKESEEYLSEELGRIFDNVGQRLVTSLQGRHAIVSLSGGYDSRLIACMLKSAGYHDVTCLTYGRKDCPDMLIAEKVAEKLDYPWLFVEYNYELIKDYTGDTGFHEYYRFAANGVSMFYLQDYFAVKYLKENKIIPEDAIFVPGHTGDFLAGTNFVKHGLKPGPESPEKLAGRIWRSKYIFCPVPCRNRASIKNRIHRTLAEKRVMEGAFSYSIHEDWDIKEKFAKFIVNSARIYEWFGYEYRLPFWDDELAGFFRQVPYDLKKNRKLYDAVLIDSYFSRYGLNFPVEIRPSARVQRDAYIKSRIKRSLPQFIKPVFLNKKDPIFYYEITRELQKDMERNGIRIRMCNHSFNSLIVQWYVEKLTKEVRE